MREERDEINKADFDSHRIERKGWQKATPAVDRSTRCWIFEDVREAQKLADMVAARIELTAEPHVRMLDKREKRRRGYIYNDDVRGYKGLMTLLEDGQSVATLLHELAHICVGTSTGHGREASHGLKFYKSLNRIYEAWMELKDEFFATLNDLPEAKTELADREETDSKSAAAETAEKRTRTRRIMAEIENMLKQRLVELNLTDGYEIKRHKRIWNCRFWWLERPNDEIRWQENGTNYFCHRHETEAELIMMTEIKAASDLAYEERYK